MQDLHKQSVEMAWNCSIISLLDDKYMVNSTLYDHKHGQTLKIQNSARVTDWVGNPPILQRDYGNYHCVMRYMLICISQCLSCVRLSRSLQLDRQLPNTRNLRLAQKWSKSPCYVQPSITSQLLYPEWKIKDHAKLQHAALYYTACIYITASKVK